MLTPYSLLIIHGECEGFHRDIKILDINKKLVNFEEERLCYLLIPLNVVHHGAV